jgi:WD40 repeat protein
MLEDEHEDSEGFRQLTLRHRAALPGFSCTLTSLFGHDGTVNDVAFSPDGKMLLSVDQVMIVSSPF